MTYRWARWGDVNAFFGLMIDNVAVMGILLTALVRVGFTPEFVLTRMLPGTALGVLVGDIAYTWMAFRLAARTGKEVTAMPLGLDTPSTFGVAFFILVPTYLEALKTYSQPQAMEFAWHVGLMTLIASGLFKLALSPLGNAIRRLVPRAGLLGSLAAIALVLIAFLPLVLHQIAGLPVAGMAALLIILITLVAHRELPGRFPGVLAALLVGSALYFAGRALGVMPPLDVGPARLFFDPAAMVGYSWWPEAFSATLNMLPVALPLALATIVGGIDCTESAATAGDEYDTREVLFVEGAASLIAGLLGGVIQTTPYIGHPAYKKMGGAAAYTLATALFVGLLGLTGGVSLLFAAFPEAALFPILVFVGLEITAQSFHHTPPKHYPALAMAALPAPAALAVVVMGTVFGGPTPASPTSENGYLVMQTLRCLASGFVVTSLLWAATLAMILDGKLRTAAVYLLIAGLCAFVGIIHSPLVPEKIGLPWHVLASLEGTPYEAAVTYQSPYHWTAAYALMAAMLWGLSLAPVKEEDAAPEGAKAPPPGKAT